MRDWVRRCVKFGWPLYVALLVSLVAIVGFLSLAEDVWEKEAFPFDKAILDAFFHLATPTLTAIFLAITTSGATPFLLGVLIIAMILAWRAQRAAAIALWAAVGGGAILDQILKYIFARPRPSLHPHLIPATGFSFPSGHSTAALAFYGTLAYLIGTRLQRRGQRIAVYVLAAIWILLVGASRNYLGVHYPSDVIAAYAATLPWLILVIAAHRCFTGRRRPQDMEITPPATGAPTPPPQLPD